ncbi:MAG: hypothetical protein RIC55_02260 [Pirellulaceae bacterium]
MALLAAHVPPQGRRRWSPDRVLREIRAWYADPPDARRAWDARLAAAARTYFGSWAQAVATANLEPWRSRKWSRARVVAAIQDRHVRGLSVDQVERSNRPLVAAARKYFGGWQAALQAAGLGDHYREKRPARDWCRELVVAEIQNFHRREGQITTVWNADPTLYSAAKDVFGTWRAAVVAAGFEPSQRRWTRPAIVAEICARRERGQSLSSRLVANRNLVAAAWRHFGSWRLALQAAEVASESAKERKSA